MPCLSASWPRAGNSPTTFGVKVARIKHSYFKTSMSNPEVLDAGFQEAWVRAIPQVKELCGEPFLAPGE